MTKTKEKEYNYNEKSRQNLRQYGGGQKKVKSEESDFSDFLTINNIPITLEDLKGLTAYDEKFSSKEVQQFFSSLKLHLQDYKDEEILTFSDLADLATICENNVLINRLLKTSKSNDKSLIDVHKAIDSLRKANEKLKDALGSNRSSRIDPRARKSKTIVDIIATYDEIKEEQRRAKQLEIMQEQEQEVSGYVTRPDEMIQ